MPGNSGLRKREGEARKRDRRKEAAEALNHLHKFATTELQMEPISDGIREIKVRETEWSGAHVTLCFKALLLFHASPLTDAQFSLSWPKRYSHRVLPGSRDKTDHLQFQTLLESFVGSVH